jgi:hypothetical protein
MDDCV